MDPKESSSNIEKNLPSTSSNDVMTTSTNKSQSRKIFIDSDMTTSMQSRRIQQHGTPDSELFSVECFQNYTAPEVFVQGLAGIVNQGDTQSMIRAQKQMLQRFEKTNEMLLNCNALSQSRLKIANDDFKKHCKVLGEMKKDLDYIFNKIRKIKLKINQQYPDAYNQAITNQRNSLAEEAEDDDDIIKNNLAKNSVTKDEIINLKNNIDEVTTVQYVQMQENENGKPIENELIKRICSVENPNINDSDGTSEDTG